MRTRALVPPAVLAAVVSCLVLAPTALAQQPLEAFLRSADERALDVRETQAAVRQARAQVDEARARLLPSFLGQAGYQRNDPAIEVNLPTGEVDEMGNPITRQVPIQPADQLSASATLTVPLLDLSAWAVFFQTEASAEASAELLEVTRQNVRLAVAQLWYQLVAQRSMVDAAERNVATAQATRDASAARVEVGVAAQLELARAEAELSRARQALAEARLMATLAARNLENLTGLAPSEQRVELDDDLRPEAPLEQYLANVDELPAMRAARQQARAADIARTSAWLALLPTISGTAVARWTNAAGFGRQDTYFAGVTATWYFDFARPARIEATSAAMEAAQVRIERAVQQAETGVFDAWHRVEASRAAAEAALAVLAASQRAADDARARVESGTAPQLEQIQAERDLFQARFAAIQALANLRIARDALRIRSGA